MAPPRTYPSQAFVLTLGLKRGLVRSAVHRKTSRALLLYVYTLNALHYRGSPTCFANDDTSIVRCNRMFVWLSHWVCVRGDRVEASLLGHLPRLEKRTHARLLAARRLSRLLIASPLPHTCVIASSH